MGGGVTVDDWQILLEVCMHCSFNSVVGVENERAFPFPTPGEFATVYFLSLPTRPNQMATAAGHRAQRTRHFFSSVSRMYMCVWCALVAQMYACVRPGPRTYMYA